MPPSTQAVSKVLLGAPGAYSSLSWDSTVRATSSCHSHTTRLGTSLNHHLGQRIRRTEPRTWLSTLNPEMSTSKGITGWENVNQSLSKEGGDSRETVRSLYDLARSPGDGTRPNCGVVWGN